MEQTWTETEIMDLILYAKQLQSDNEDLRAGIIFMQAALDREEAKVKRLKNILSMFGLNDKMN